MRKNKKKYLSSYLLQQSKINRLKQMIVLNPDLENDYKDQIEKAKTLRNDIEKKIALVDNGISQGNHGRGAVHSHILLNQRAAGQQHRRSCQTHRTFFCENL